VFAYLLYPKDSFEINPCSIKDRSERTLFNSLTYHSVLEFFMKIFLLVILLLPLYDRFVSVLQALQPA